MGRQSISSPSAGYRGDESEMVSYFTKIRQKERVCVFIMPKDHNCYSMLMKLSPRRWGRDGWWSFAVWKLLVTFKQFSYHLPLSTRMLFMTSWLFKWRRSVLGRLNVMSINTTTRHLSQLFPSLSQELPAWLTLYIFGLKWMYSSTRNSRNIQCPFKQCFIPNHSS